MLIDNCVLKNGKPQIYLFDGGYYSFDGDKKPECHYYVQDYQGPRSNKEGFIILREKTNIYVRGNRMVVNAHTDSIEQVTHYYPYGGIIGNLSSNQETQKYKYSGKELDRTYGLDLYDFHARQYDAALPVFDRPDPLAEDFTWLTPYNYCAGDPVNYYTFKEYVNDELPKDTLIFFIREKHISIDSPDCSIKTEPVETWDTVQSFQLIRKRVNL